MEKSGAEGADLLNPGIREWAGSVFVELCCSPERTGSAPGIEEANDALDFKCLGRKGATRAFASGVIHFPAFSNQNEEPAPISESRLNGVMRQVMQGEMRGVSGLFLSCDGTVLAGASKESGTIRLFGDLDL